MYLPDHTLQALSDAATLHYIGRRKYFRRACLVGKSITVQNLSYDITTTLIAQSYHPVSPKQDQIIGAKSTGHSNLGSSLSPSRITTRTLHSSQLPSPLSVLNRQYGPRSTSTLHLRPPSSLNHPRRSEEINRFRVSQPYSPLKPSPGTPCNPVVDPSFASHDSSADMFWIPSCRPATNLVPDSSVKSIADSYFSAGETIFSIVSGQAVTSGWFKRS